MQQAFKLQEKLKTDTVIELVLDEEQDGKCISLLRW
jgi:hypothetical protein